MRTWSRASPSLVSPSGRSGAVVVRLGLPRVEHTRADGRARRSPAVHGPHSRCRDLAGAGWVAQQQFQRVRWRRALDRYPASASGGIRTQSTYACTFTVAAAERARRISRVARSCRKSGRAPASMRLWVMTGTARAWRKFWRGIAELPLVLRWSVRSGLVFGMVGAVVGLLLGLAAYPATAWFAVLEVGIPGFVVGMLLGAAAGFVTLAARRLARTRPAAPSEP